jgi:addiction module RelE/StbE family toxin
MMALIDHNQGRVQVSSSPCTGQEYKYEIKMLEHCEKTYKKLVKKNNILQKWVETYLEELKTHPYMGEKLHANFPGCRSIHFLGNSYRIIYKVIDEPKPEILVLEISHRKDAYTDLAKALSQGN